MSTRAYLILDIVMGNSEEAARLLVHNAMKAEMENSKDMAKRVKREIKGKQETRKFQADVSPEYAFWCRDGRITRHMKEPSDAIFL